MSERPKDLDAAMRSQLDDELVDAALKQAAGAAPPAQEKPQPTGGESSKAPAQAQGSTPLRFRNEISEIGSTVLKIPTDRFDAREKMSRYGVDSIIVTEIVKRISDLLGQPIAPTVFFEARHFEELADILYQRYARKIARRYAEAPATNAPVAAPSAGRAPHKEAAVAAVETDADVKSWVGRFKAIAGQGTKTTPPVQDGGAPRRTNGDKDFEPVAIIAIEGVFPESADLQAFERHLRAGDDCIREVPADRWDWRQVFGDPQQGEFTNVKYGGFTPDIDKFDPLFFGMSPREAELMDPQHRLFIQCVWKLIESAGYAPKSLSGRKVGIFIGINLQDYAHLVDRAGAMEALHLTSLGHMFCPNRLSFYLDTHGPSQVIDTACSSSLVALHRAVLSVQHEGCEMAVAGGANLLISPDMHIMYSKVGMICEDGRCKTFSRRANGYVRADGVGAVLVKPLWRAEQDGDTILAVIRGSAENHGGMSTSLTAPNPKAQASLIVEAHRRAGVDPRSVGYIECHGTGTSLGDPIEINGLKIAFEELHRGAGLAAPQVPYCGLGSVKSNIGHAETAAGIAGVIKTVLALRNRRLYPTLHCTDLNPMIELERSPFFILQQGKVWSRPVVDGAEQPRRAGVSSFGAGGSNAHVVIEEYVGTPLPAVQSLAPSLILLSAKNEARLGDLAASMLRFLDEAIDAPDIADIAFTLQVGREAMAERLCLVVDSVADLKVKLGRIVHGGEAVAGSYRGYAKRVKQAPGGSETSSSEIVRLFAEGDVGRLAELWVSGVEIDWPSLYDGASFSGGRPRRVMLPTYPFAKQRHWLLTGTVTPQDRRSGGAGAPLHPLIHRNTSDLSEQRFSSAFTGKEFFLSDHVVMGEKILPGVAYLEMARAAVKQAGTEADRDRIGIRLKNVIWAQPFAVGGKATTLHIALSSGQNAEVAYRIYSRPEGGEPVLHSQGTALPKDAPAAPDRLDLASLRDRITAGQPDLHRLDARQCYEAFKVMGIAYGPRHQGLETVYFSAPVKETGAPPQVLARLVLPADSASFVLDPGLMDSALQACIGLMAGSGHALPTSASAGTQGASLPFALEEFELLAKPPAALWAWIRYAEGSSPADRVQKLHIDLCDDEGEVCVRMRGFSSRSPERTQAARANATLMYEPVWVDRPAVAGSVAWSSHRILLCDLGGAFPQSLEREIADAMPGSSCVRLDLSGAAENWYAQAAIEVFEAIKAELARKESGRALIQVVVPGNGAAALLAGISGLLKTGNRESARVFSQLVEANAVGLTEALLAERSGRDVHVRYETGVRRVLQWRETARAAQAVPWKDNGVYLITGGGGGLGLAFARQIAAQTKNATVFLCGRSEPSAAQTVEFDRLSSAGLKVQYRALDVARREQVDALVADIVRTSGRIDGVLHGAGVLKDNFILKKSAQEFGDVLAPKVAGTLHLDQATADLGLDFFVLFASAAGALGSAGQTDYAAANAFMDAFAHHRNTLVRGGQRQGQTVSIDWPLWADGGMRMEPAARAMMEQATGMVALPFDAGIRTFNAIVFSGAPQTLVLHGSPGRIRRSLAAPERPADPVETKEAAAAPADTEEWRAKVEQILLHSVATLMKFDLQDLDVDTEWNDYGFDSITLTDFSNRLNQKYQLELTPTVFFENSTIASFAAWLTTEHGPKLAAALGLSARPRPAPRAEAREAATPAAKPEQAPAMPRARGRGGSDDAVAIIGMSGRFPMAKDLEEFWDNLLAGKDCITEIPADRWDWKAFYGDPATNANKTNVKWGGFIDGVADFDARFFNISPREAALMDPQQRLLMQYAWKAIEDAGYSAASLSGSSTAMFIGTASSGYGALMAQSGSAIESYSSTGTVGSVGPNRMSYFLNLHGPSEPIETACSSSLVAIHRALSAMANGDCDQAIVGGINLIISPETHISFNKAGMLCADGRCKTFSKHANGYVRGEGVGMLFLKKLKAAERDGDHIYGVIRGSAENHGGRAVSLTAPNPKAQAELLKAAYTRAGVNPRTVGYIDAHGTGTELGDPIEISGLKAAFRDLYQATGRGEVAGAHCGLGSVKTNIGHLELAAGVASVIKVLLQLKHKTLVKSLHCDEVNPYIQLQDSPFYLVRENREWTPARDLDGRELPRRAGISSFGFGGVNAHIVIEEYRQEKPQVDDGAQPSLVVLSAKNPDRLKAYAGALLSFITAPPPAAADAPSRARRVLTERALSLVADILRIDRGEIGPAHPLEDYGFDPMHRSILRERLQEAFGQDIPARVFLENHSIASIVAGALDGNAALGERLAQEDEPAGLEPEGPTEDAHGFALADLAYTLQVGRDSQDERLAIVAHSMPELADKLRAFLDGRAEAAEDIHVGQAKQNKALLASFGADEELREALEKWLQRGKFSKLLDLWSKGLNIDWELLYGESRPYPRKPRRISVPGYPFAEQRHWIEARPATPDHAATSAALHPLLHENISTLGQTRFSTRLSGGEFFLADHRVQGQKVLPGVAYLEMARAAVAHATKDTRWPEDAIRLKDVVWVRPAVVDQPRDMRIDLTPDAQGAIRYEISGTAAGDSAGPDRQVHSQGIALFPSVVTPSRLDLGALRARAGMTSVNAEQCYELFRAAGLDYGPAHQGIGELHVGAGEALARLVLPESVAHTLGQYVLHPSLMDSALQACIGLSLGADAASPDGKAKLSLPFAIETIDIFGACTDVMWAWLRRRGSPGDRVQKLNIDLCDDQGQVRAQIRGFSARVIDAGARKSAPVLRLQAEPSLSPEPVGQAVGAVAPSADSDALWAKAVAYFRELLATTLRAPVEDIRVDDSFESYGIDSMMVMELTGVLEKSFGELSRTLFFEHQTLAELVDHFLDQHRPQLLALVDAAPLPVTAVAQAGYVPPQLVAAASPRAEARPAPVAKPETGAFDIAVIGLSGRYPQARDIEEFWLNLRDGKDCITEVPADRWDWRAYYNKDGDQPGMHRCKWGGFIADADKFDPLFFNIPPSVAEYMDPQERLFLEHAWMAMEDAGYRREDLQRPQAGSAGDDLPAQVGVYAGVMYGEYQLLGLEANLGGSPTRLANFYASIANRVSYTLNLHGPSMAVDTMCSSSLTAIHLACQDLILHRTDLALAGGVNLSVHPNKYGLLSQGQFISSRGLCESFGADGDGYVPSEGVGVVMLKRLADAERDGDHIHGVIKASALNHGGKTHGYSVPNPKAQQTVIGRALRDAGVDARAIGYVEAHGTGTKLGDPIEITGLTKAFGQQAGTDQPRWIGSVKSNIGHCESAAGIAALTKVLLQMREGQIAPSLHSRTLNPNIRFSTTPFRVNQELREWPQPVIDGRVHPRTAGISSFGAGGANAHVIVEEYVGPQTSTARRADDTGAQRIVVLSARTEEQLGQYAESLLAFLRRKGAELSLRDMAYTLQVGREPMPYRLGFLAASAQEAAGKLGRFLDGGRDGLRTDRAKLSGDGADDTASLIAQHRHDDLLAAWVRGAAVDWHRLYAGDDDLPSRISVPTYPFARERYWLTRPDASLPPAQAASMARHEHDTLMLRPEWREQAVRPGGEVAYGEHRILLIGGPIEIQGAICTELRSDGGTADRCFGDYAVQLFAQIKDVLHSKPREPVLLQVVIAAEPSGCPAPLLGALAAMLKTARMENPRLVGQLIELDPDASPSASTELAALLRENGQASETHVRWRQGQRQVPAWVEMGAAPRKILPVWKKGGTYLITGGAGGLGLIFAREIAGQVGDVRLILTGRSPLDDRRRAEIAALQAMGARVDYRTVDVGDAASVRALIESIGHDGTLNGIIHSAGIIRDGFIIKKSAADVRDVLAAKVSGTVNLDLATRSLDLDFLILFSSLAGAVGNAGQCDYATANAFMDAYAAHRNHLAAGTEGSPKGHMLSINWPLWEQGGMDVDAQSKEAMWRTAGLRPLRTDAGIDAFYTGLNSGSGQVMVLQGDVPRLRQLFLASSAPDAAPIRENTPEQAADGIGGEQLLFKTEALISKLLSDLLKMPLHRIEADVPLEQYGVDSVAMMKLTSDLEKLLGPVSKTLFFEFPTIQAVSAHLVEAFARQLTALFRIEPPAVPKETGPVPVATPVVDAPRATANETAAASETRDVAVIGISGRFPMARDVEEFWHNLTQGRDCITEVPSERWDHSAYFDPDKNKVGKTYCKWGGFLDEVDRFDAPFFKISATEAELLDPQERLFLEAVWNLLESAGYLGETLRRLTQSRVGVFVGSMSQQYHAFKSDLVRESLVVLSSPSSIANRVSYFFNFQGPSIAIDTMCSSALNAVHMACDSLFRGDCRIAIAGGVNLTIHPKKYIGLSAGQMIGSHPDSTSFGDGDGYLPAEAVGAVLLKPLRQAIADGDEIFAVIKSTAINHGGRSNGYRVPSASAQADLIADNFAKAGIDPRTVTYVESAANGSLLGDAIEVRALAEGFGRHTDERQFCAIGSVKSNIGHAEAASGVSQLIKVILQLRHRQLAPTIKAQPLNPNIDFAETPFYLQRQLEDWRRPVLALDGSGSREYPRRATVSSFGAGGSNAHLIVEEYDDAPAPAAADAPRPYLVLLSAKTARQRDALVREMLAFVERRPAISVADLAYTLQTAREAMEHRLALVVEGRDELIEGLRTYLANDIRTAARIFTGDTEQDNSDIKTLLSGKTGQSMFELLLAEKDLEKLAVYWVKGVKIAWQPMHAGCQPNRIALPTYPFDRRNHWLADVPVSSDALPSASDSAAPFAVDARQSVPHNMTRYLAQRLAGHLGIPVEVVSATKNLQDYGVDSISLMRLQRDLEETFQVKIPMRDVLANPTLVALAELAAAAQQALPREDGVAAVDASFPALHGAASPLSEGQKGLWLLHQLAPRMSAYNVPVALRFKAGLDIGLFKQACEHMLRRFPVLGAVFGQEDGQPRQRVPEGARLAFEHRSIDKAADVAALLRAESKRSFDLEKGPLFRVHVLPPASGKEAYVLLTAHHIVLDGRSAALLVQELLETYRLLQSGDAPREPDASAGYGDFVRWQQHFLAGDGARAQLAYWKDKLAGDLPTLSLPCDYPRPAVKRFDGASHEAALAPALARKIAELAKSLRVNPSVVFLGALNLLLHRYSGDDDILVGMPTLGRPQTRFDDVVGCFVNMITVRSRVSGQQDVGGFLKALQLTVADGLDNADYPFSSLLEVLKVDRDPARSPLFQVMFAYQNFALPSGAVQVPVEIVPGINQEGSHDFALEVYRAADGFRLKIDYDTALFALRTIGGAMDHYIHLLESIVAAPGAAVADHGLLSSEEESRIIAGSEARDADGAVDRSVVELFQRQARLSPLTAALLFKGRPLAYRELDQQSSQLANVLADRGVVAGDPVGVCMGRGPQWIVAMLAIWKAGAVYVPLGPDYPPERIRHVLDDSKIKLLLTDAAARDQIMAPGAGEGRTCLAIDEMAREISEASAAFKPRSQADSAAYVIYTSGSTGLPKGVAISHRSLSHHCQVMRDHYQLVPSDKILLFASMNVDASLEQALPGLLCGATVVIRPDGPWSVLEFRRKLAEAGMTVIDVPPSYLHELLLDAERASDWASLRSVRLAITGGEALAPETLAHWRGGPMREARLVNAYGPTETTITSIVFEAGRDAADAGMIGGVPIGRPLPGESAYILDAHGRLAPVGVPGELHIGGAGLAIGYLNQPELTRRRFVENPADPGSLVYKTGDRARWLADGNIAFLGRSDHQVKVRGFRVECGEVEAALRDLESVKQAVVLSRPVNGNPQLVAFVVPSREDAGAEWKQALARTLPDYMVPSVFVSLPHIPMTPGGKVDRIALMRHERADSVARGHVAPRTEVEAELAGIWRRVLNVEQVGVHDNFFDLGGHSLLAVRLVALIHQQLGKELPLSSLFEAPDIARQARILERNEQPWSPLVCLQPKGGLAPWFCVHAVSGNVLSYRELSRHMGERRPFYALQAPDVGVHAGTVEGLAALYVAAIRTVQPKGPYHLGGWSMGGVIAYEMARQLRHVGEQVATLALIESYTPDIVKALERGGSLPDDTDAAPLMAFARELGFEDPAATVARAADVASLPGRLEWILCEAKRTSLLPADMELARLHRMFALFQANVRAMNCYTVGQYGGGAALFAVRSANMTQRGGWSDAIRGDLTTETVPGDHYSVLKQPNVRDLAAKLARYIDEKAG